MEDKKVRRYFFTINNPFWNPLDFEEVNISKTDLELKLDFYNLRYLKDESVVDLFEFHFIKKIINNITYVIERPFFKDFDCLKEFVQQLEHHKYSCGQLECGELKETQHIQMFIVFEIGKRVSTIKNYFPTAHIEFCKRSNAECRAYCSKKETRVDNYCFESGQFAEERARTDYRDFIELVQSGMSETELGRLYPTLFLKHIGNIEKIRESYRHELHCDSFRNVDVTYIYGPPRTGKTYSVINKYGMRNVHLLRIYRNGMFDTYTGQDVLCFDEFDSQIKITEMNAYLDTYAMTLPARFYDRQASFTKVYIIANIPLSEQYKEIQQTRPEIYKAFVKRINTIIRFDSYGRQHIEKTDKVQ